MARRRQVQASQLVASAEQDSQCPDSLHRDALTPASASGRDSDHLATSPVGRGVDRISGLESSSNLSLHLLPDPPPSRLGQSQPRSRHTHLCTSAARPGSQAKPTISKKPHLVVRSCSTLAQQGLMIYYMHTASPTVGAVNVTTASGRPLAESHRTSSVSDTLRALSPAARRCSSLFY
ncbi:hypothetical protein KCU95_g11076, partial [Aureobasidium melanogenum]